MEEGPEPLVLGFHCSLVSVWRCCSQGTRSADLGNFCLGFSNDLDELDDETNLFFKECVKKRMDL